MMCLQAEPRPRIMPAKDIRGELIGLFYNRHVCRDVHVMRSPFLDQDYIYSNTANMNV